MKMAGKFLVRKSTHFDVVTFVSGQEDEPERESREAKHGSLC